MRAPRVAGDLLGQPVHPLQVSILEDLIRSAGNKGTAAVEAATPDDPADLARWERQGFGFAGPLLRRSVAAVGAAARCT
ncbi:MAG: hypothetical protein ACJ77N_13285 [Chloroflexota bacterium]